MIEDLREGQIVDNPILIHAEQIAGTAFGDPRLVKRGQHYMQQCSNINQ